MVHSPWKNGYVQFTDYKKILDNMSVKPMPNGC